MNFAAILPHIWILPAATTALVLLALVAYHLAKRGNTRESPALDDIIFESGWGFVTMYVAILAVASVVATLVALVPYNPKYWVFYDYSGTVTSVSNTFTDASGTLSSGYMVVLDDDIRVKVDDPRILGTEGSQIELLCTHEWVYLAADRINCAIR